MIKIGENIAGGVSPLKGRRSSKKSSSTGRGKGLLITGGSQYKGGTSGSGGRKSTFTKGRKQHGGFGESTSTKNKAGYRKNTKFKVPTSKQFPSSGGGDNTTNPPPQKPFGWTPGGDMDFKDMFNININNANQQNTGGTEETKTTKTTTAPDVKTYKKTKPKKGNEFADNCYDENGAKRQGHIYYSTIKEGNILCDWTKNYKGSSGTFDYDKPGTTEEIITPGATTSSTSTERRNTGSGNNRINQVN